MTAWRVPAGCEAGTCIEVAELAAVGYIAIRCPADGDRQTIAATRAEFAALVAACRAGEYDDLTREDRP